MPLATWHEICVAVGAFAYLLEFWLSWRHGKCGLMGVLEFALLMLLLTRLN